MDLDIYFSGRGYAFLLKYKPTGRWTLTSGCAGGSSCWGSGGGGVGSLIRVNSSNILAHAIPEIVFK